MKKRFDRYASVFFLVLGVAVLIYSQTLTKNSFGSSIGPAAMPTMLSVLLIVLSIVNMINAFRGKLPEKTKGNLDYRKFLPFLAALLVYVLVLEPLGYVISTFLFLLVTFQIMQRGHYLKAVLIALAFSVGVYALYVGVAKGTLPPLPFIGI